MTVTKAAGDWMGARFDTNNSQQFLLHWRAFDKGTTNYGTIGNWGGRLLDSDSD